MSGAELLAALEAAGAETAEVRAALAALERPPVIVVIGRVSSGKSALLNAWLGRAERPVGLGGVTSAPSAVDVGGITVIDTPGIDATDRAVGLLAPLLHTACACVWVVDGLQPATDSERAVLAAALPAEVPLHVVVSRADLLGDEVDDVLARVRALAPSAVVCHAADLRRGRPEVPTASADARHARLRTALRRGLDLPPLPDVDALGERLRARWRETVLAVEAEVTATAPPDREVALRRLAHRSAAARDAFRDGFGDLQPPAPAPQPVLGGIGGGVEAARRVLRATTARWLMDGLVALEDWLEPVSAEVTAARAARERAEALVARWTGGDPAPR